MNYAFRQRGEKSSLLNISILNRKHNYMLPRLREAGIKSFISNAHAATMIPMSVESIGLHVRIEEAPLALKNYQIP